MKKQIITLFILFTAISTIFAQIKPEITKKYYTDENGKLYWNKELPVYLILSTTPNGQGVNLKNKVSENYDNPFYFDTEGANYIRTRWAVDNSTGKYVIPQQEVLWEIFADSKSPHTNIHFNDAKKYVNNSKTYYGNKLKVSFSSSDQLSGLENIFFTTGNSPAYQKYTDSLTFTQEGEQALSYFSVDNVGNAEEVKNISFIVDNTAPQSKINVKGVNINNENILSQSTKIYIETHDEYSNVKYTYYKIDSGAKTLYNGQALPTALLPDGEHIIKFYSVDNVYNEEAENEFKFYLDKKAPVLSSEYIGNKYETAGKIYFSKDTKFEIKADDNKAGVKEIRYVIDNEEEKTYTQALILPQNQAWHTIKYYAIDNSDNTTAISANSKYKTQKIFVDLTEPNINYKLTGDFFKSRDTIFVSSDTKFILNASDSESGVQFMTYKLSEGAQETKYISSFACDCTTEGVKSVYIFAYDNVNNKKSEKFEVYADKSGPSIEYKFSIQSKNKNGDLDVYPYNSLLFLIVQDKKTDVKNIYYSVNGLPEKIYEKSIAGFVKGQKNTVKIKATDILNNEQTTEIVFFAE